MLGKYNLYDRDVVTVKQLGDDVIKVQQLSSCRTRGLELEDEVNFSPKYSVNEHKLDNSISRSRTKIHELALCNTWDYFVTLTLSPDKYNRYELESYKKDLGNFLHNYNRRCSESDKVRYILIPEQHKDGAWHMHGLIKGIKPKDLVVNSNGYLAWTQYENKFGYISMGKIKDKNRIASYITKYITKDLSQTVSELGAHLYYASQNLKVGKIIFQGHALLHDDWDYIHPDGYCRTKIFSGDKDFSEYLEVLE